MTIVATEDTRNLEWRKNNKGSALLQKMGWKEGEGIGKRATNTNALRAIKRREGLGIGAKIESEGGSSERSNHFAALLQDLQSHHAPPSSSSSSSTKKQKKEKKKAKKKEKKAKLTLAQNRVSAGHARKMRDAKFGQKSAADLACIFGDSSLKQTAEDSIYSSFQTQTAAPVSTSSSSESEEKSKKKSKKDKKKKKSKA